MREIKGGLDAVKKANPNYVEIAARDVFKDVKVDRVADELPKASVFNPLRKKQIEPLARRSAIGDIEPGPAGRRHPLAQRRRLAPPARRVAFRIGDMAAVVIGVVPVHALPLRRATSGGQPGNCCLWTAVEASNINQIAVNSQPGYPKCNNGGTKHESAS